MMRRSLVVRSNFGHMAFLLLALAAEQDVRRQGWPRYAALRTRFISRRRAETARRIHGLFRPQWQSPAVPERGEGSGSLSAFAGGAQKFHRPIKRRLKGFERAPPPIDKTTSYYSAGWSQFAADAARAWPWRRSSNISSTPLDPAPPMSSSSMRSGRDHGLARRSLRLELAFDVIEGPSHSGCNNMTRSRLRIDVSGSAKNR
jgi:hypothetical protein